MRLFREADIHSPHNKDHDGTMGKERHSSISLLTIVIPVFNEEQNPQLIM